jgi:hypothetical protein
MRIDAHGADARASQHCSGGRAGKATANDRDVGVRHEHVVIPGTRTSQRASIGRAMLILQQPDPANHSEEI